MLLELVATMASHPTSPSFWPIISPLYCDIDIIDFLMKKEILAELPCKETQMLLQFSFYLKSQITKVSDYDFFTIEFHQKINKLVR